MTSLPLARLLAVPAALLPALLLAGQAAAQGSLSFGADSDYRVRGVSLTSGRAVVRAGAAYDHRSGLYAGVSVLGGSLSGGGLSALGGVAYAGFARRTASGIVADVGVTSTRVRNDFTVTIPPIIGPYDYTPGRAYTVRYRTEYSEVYAGLLRGNASLHVYLSPNYLRPGQGTAYVDMNAALRPTARLRLFGHAGLLVPLEYEAAAPVKTRADIRVGAALQLPHAELQLAWTTLSRRVEYRPGYRSDRQAVVLSATAYF